MDEEFDVDTIDEELNLPGDLVNLNFDAKKELLQFKRSHNEVSLCSFSFLLQRIKSQLVFIYFSLINCREIGKPKY